VPAAPASKTRLLVVDDDRDVLEAFEAALARHVHVATCGDAGEALRVVEGAAFDAVLVDLMMPDMDGATFIGALRERGAVVPVALMSASREGAETARRLAVPFLAKPFRVRDVLQWLELALAQPATP
jgi:CheY-like chemotaxis protein